MPQMYVCMCMLKLYIYIYIYRERERETQPSLIRMNPLFCDKWFLKWHPPTHTHKAWMKRQPPKNEQMFTIVIMVSIIIIVIIIRQGMIILCDAMPLNSNQTSRWFPTHVGSLMALCSACALHHQAADVAPASPWHHGWSPRALEGKWKAVKPDLDRGQNGGTVQDPQMADPF